VRDYPEHIKGKNDDGGGRKKNRVQVPLMDKNVPKGSHRRRDKQNNNVKGENI